MLNQSKKKTLIIAGALATMLAAGGAAFADNKGSCKNDRGHHSRGANQVEKRLDRMTEKLELSDDQRNQVKQSMESHKERMKELAMSNRAALKAELAAILTPEQMDKLEAMEEKRRSRHRNHVES